MNAETYDVTAVFSEDNVNGTTTINLLKVLEKNHPEAKVIYVVLLSPYSLELNLIEQFLRHFKKKII